MKIMYWNCTAPAGSGKLNKQKIAMIAARIAVLQPDILCLDEVSALLGDATTAQAWADDAGIDYAYAGGVVNAGTHLNTVVFLKNGLATKVRVHADGIPAVNWGTERTKRNLIEAKFTDPQKNTGREIGIWFLHANASRTNGKFAVDLAAKHVAAHNNDVILGDFNADSSVFDNVNIILPMFTHPDGHALRYSQWTTVEAEKPGTIKSGTRHIKPGNLIDYAVSKTSSTPTITLKAQDSLRGMTTALNGEDSLHLMHIDFDHFPIVYELTVNL